MKSESQFRLFSIAVLALAALVAAPEERASEAVLVEEVSPVFQAEIDLVRDVESINNGQFQPFVVGQDLTAEILAAETLTAGLHNSKNLSARRN